MDIGKDPRIQAGPANLNLEASCPSSGDPIRIGLYEGGACELKGSNLNLEASCPSSGDPIRIGLYEGGACELKGSNPSL